MVYGDRSLEVTPLVHQRLHKIQDQLFVKVSQAENEIAGFLNRGDTDGAVALMNAVCGKLGTETVTEWRNFWMFLFARFRDGATNRAPTQRVCQPGEKHDCVFRPIPDSFEQGYSPAWYARIVKVYNSPSQYFSCSK